ncbi:MAG: hypothetical protein ACLGGV_03410 [Bacteroidia bacterium]
MPTFVLFLKTSSSHHFSIALAHRAVNRYRHCDANLLAEAII